MNVTEIVRELKMTKEEFFPLVAELGFDIGERAIKVDDTIAVRLIAAIKNHHKLGQRKSLFSHERQVEEVKAELDPGAKVLDVPDPVTTKQFAELLGKPVTDLISILMRNGVMATINENIDFDTATIIAEDMGYKTQRVAAKVDDRAVEREEQLKTALSLDTDKKLQPRPPVIVVMGHVDHGKTTLLDAIRKTNIAAQEAGGITQTIGAYQIEYKDRNITFIDTPGHEAFTAMRSRGANVADVAILVVAADDGLKPQTIEAIGILEKAKLPFVVAINKMDKPDADVEKVKKGLSEVNLIPEDWGGKTICVPISAKANQHIDELLDMVLLVADLHQDKIQANPDRTAVGTIIESRIDKDSGPIATVLVQTGTLRVGDIVEVGDVAGKIKALSSWRGTPVREATPATPVRFLGLKNAPVVGDILTITNDPKVLKRKQKKSYQSFGYMKHKTEIAKTGIQLPIILKADTLGSLEAVAEAVEKLHFKDVEIDIIRRGLGNFTEKDINQAVSSKARLIGFNVDMTAAAADYALGTQTTAQSFTVIYKLLEHITAELEALLPPDTTYKKIGEVRLLAVFRSTGRFAIVGGRVISGSIRHKAISKIVRNGKVVGEATISQLQSNKKDVSEVLNGNECGIRIDTTITPLEGDMIDIYLAEENKRVLEPVS
ncbi:MAG: translation initiation factor IF-2 [Candidatus Kerfeldbacteria bacterium]|nr:translation initiation factor IF-2 [Candidatus Kerfeldbacteria bacterium]